MFFVNRVSIRHLPYCTNFMWILNGLINVMTTELDQIKQSIIRVFVLIFYFKRKFLVFTDKMQNENKEMVGSSPESYTEVLECLHASSPKPSTSTDSRNGNSQNFYFIEEELILIENGIYIRHKDFKIVFIQINFRLKQNSCGKHISRICKLIFKNTVTESCIISSG